MAINSRLYPPIVPDAMSAVLREKDLFIYFSLSSYNALKKKKNVQVSITHQKSNSSALNNDYSSGIMLINTIEKNLDIQGEYNYFIKISPDKFRDGKLGLNQFYKIQLRFTSIAASNIDVSAATEDWLEDNLDYFS